MADASQNKPKKELAYALVGVAAFLAIVLLIGISAFLRPAGNHVAPEAAVEEATTEEVVADAESTTEEAVAVEAEAVDTAESADVVEAETAQ